LFLYFSFEVCASAASQPSNQYTTYLGYSYANNRNRSSHCRLPLLNVEKITHSCSSGYST